MKTQIVKSENLLHIYSLHPKINSILRTLVALHGSKNLWPAVSDFVLHDEAAKNLSSKEIWELYQLTKWIVLGGAN